MQHLQTIRTFPRVMDYTDHQTILVSNDGDGLT